MYFQLHILSYVCLIQVLNQIQLSVVVADSFNKTWSYRFDSNSVLFSFTVSVSLQSTKVHIDTVNDIENNLRVNTSSVIPSGYVLTNEGFMVSAFQPNSKYTYSYIISVADLGGLGGLYPPPANLKEYKKLNVLI